MQVTTCALLVFTTCNIHFFPPLIGFCLDVFFLCLLWSYTSQHNSPSLSLTFAFLCCWLNNETADEIDYAVRRIIYFIREKDEHRQTVTSSPKEKKSLFNPCHQTSCNPRIDFSFVSLFLLMWISARQCYPWRSLYNIPSCPCLNQLTKVVNLISLSLSLFLRPFLTHFALIACLPEQMSLVTEGSFSERIRLSLFSSHFN